MTMVVGMFDSLLEVQRAVVDLVHAGYARNSISILIRDGHVGAAGSSHETGTSSSSDAYLADADPAASASLPADHLPASIDVARKARILAGGPLATVLRESSGEYPEGPLVRALTSAGLGLMSARYFTEAICNGAVMIAINCEDRYVRDTRDLLDAHAMHSQDYGRPAQPPRPSEMTL
jgi:hypothetical protein